MENRQMSFLKTIARMSGLYALMLGSILSVTTLIVYIVSPSQVFLERLRLVLIVEALVLTAMGVLSMFHFGEYQYLKQSTINPPMAREAVEHYRERIQRTPVLGVILGLVGVTLFLIAIFL